MKKKVLHWIKRYGLAEINGLIVGLVFSNLFIFLTKSILISAFIGTWTTNIGFYGTILFQDVKKSLKHHKDNNLKFGIISILKLARNMFLEFGIAEYLDSFLIRPFFMVICPLLISNYSLAVLVANLIANITFYIPTIMSYELRKKYLD